MLISLLKFGNFLAILPLDKLSAPFFSSHNVYPICSLAFFPPHFYLFIFFFSSVCIVSNALSLRFLIPCLIESVVGALNFIFHFGHCSLQLHNLAILFYDFFLFAEILVLFRYCFPDFIELSVFSCSPLVFKKMILNYLSGNL